MVAFFFGCEEKAENKSLFSDEEIVAEINGKKISAAAVDEQIRFFEKTYPDFSDVNNELKDRLYTLQVNALTDREILMQEAKKRNVRFDDDQFMFFFNSLSAGYTDEEFDFLLKEKNLTPEKWKRLNRERYIVNRLIDAEVTKKITISNADIKDYISKNPVLLRQETQYEIQHILVRSSAVAALILVDLKNGASFSAFVDKYSISADKVNEGNMGFIDKKLLPKKLSRAVFALKQIGEITPSVESPLGYHIFKLLSVSKAHRLSRKTINRSVTAKIRAERFDAAYQTWMDDLRAKSTLKTMDAASKKNRL